MTSDSSKLSQVPITQLNLSHSIFTSNFHKELSQVGERTLSQVPMTSPSIKFSQVPISQLNYHKNFHK